MTVAAAEAEFRAALDGLDAYQKVELAAMALQSGGIDIATFGAVLRNLLAPKES